MVFSDPALFNRKTILLCLHLEVCGSFEGVVLCASPAVMSLHEFLREGGEASYRIVNRLSHLIQNLDISGFGSPFPFSTAGHKNSWTGWDGKSDSKGNTYCVCVRVCVESTAHLCTCGEIYASKSSVLNAFPMRAMDRVL